MYGLYRQWLSLDIFQKFTKDQQYKLMRLFLILTFALAALFLGLALLRDNERGGGAAADVSEIRREQTLAVLRERVEELQLANRPDDAKAVARVAKQFEVTSAALLQALREGEADRIHMLLTDCYGLLKSPATMDLFKDYRYPVLAGDNSQPPQEKIAVQRTEHLSAFTAGLSARLRLLLD